MTLYMDTVLRAMPKPELEPRLYLPPETSLAEGQRLRDEGYITVAGFGETKDHSAEANRLGCTLVLSDGKVIKS